MAGRLTRGEIHLVRFPPPDKERPVLVLTRDSAIAGLARVTIAPITPTVRDVPSEVQLGPEDGMKQPCAVNLHNITTIRRDLLGRQLAELGIEKMRLVCAALRFSLGCQ